MNVIYKRVEKLLEDSGLTLSTFARKLGEERHRIQGIRAKKQRVPEEIMIKIVERFNVNPAWLLTGKGPIYSHDLRNNRTPVNEGISVAPIEGKGSIYFHDLCNKKIPVNEGIAVTPVDIKCAKLPNEEKRNEENISTPTDLKGTLSKLNLIDDSTYTNSGVDSIPIDFKWIWGKLNDEQRKELINIAKGMVELNEIKKFLRKFAISLEEI